MKSILKWKHLEVSIDNIFVALSSVASPELVIFHNIQISPLKLPLKTLDFLEFCMLTQPTKLLSHPMWEFSLQVELKSWQP